MVIWFVAPNRLNHFHFLSCPNWINFFFVPIKPKGTSLSALLCTEVARLISVVCLSSLDYCHSSTEATRTSNNLHDLVRLFLWLEMIGHRGHVSLMGHHKPMRTAYLSPKWSKSPFFVFEQIQYFIYPSINTKTIDPSLIFREFRTCLCEWIAMEKRRNDSCFSLLVTSRVFGVTCFRRRKWKKKKDTIFPCPHGC